MFIHIFAWFLLQCTGRHFWTCVPIANDNSQLYTCFICQERLTDTTLQSVIPKTWFGPVKHVQIICLLLSTQLKPTQYWYGMSEGEDLLPIHICRPCSFIIQSTAELQFFLTILAINFIAIISESSPCHTNGLISWSKFNALINSWSYDINTLQWRHNVCDGISNHQPGDCLLKHLLRRISKKTSKLCVADL